MTRYTRDSLAKDYKNLGLAPGDVVLMRAALNAIGRPDFKSKQDHINAILDVIGSEGTLVGLSFSQSFIRLFGTPPKDFIYRDDAPATTGSFANIMLKHPGRERSPHPTNSFVAIGRDAKNIVGDHDETRHSYFPMEKLLELDAKMILVGCTEASPGFTTTHLAEYNLGLLRKIKFPWLHRVFFEKNGQIRLFKRTEIGGDSNTFYKFYPLYREKGVLKEGYIGKAKSYLIKCRDAYDIEYKTLQSNPKFCICDSKDCVVCAGRNIDNLINWPQFYLRKSVAIGRRLFFQKR